MSLRLLSTGWPEASLILAVRECRPRGGRPSRADRLKCAVHHCSEHLATEPHTKGLTLGRQCVTVAAFVPAHPTGPFRHDATTAAAATTQSIQAELHSSCHCWLAGWLAG